MNVICYIKNVEKNLRMGRVDCCGGGTLFEELRYGIIVLEMTAQMAEDKVPCLKMFLVVYTKND
jgi:hypothetical protein